MRTPTTVTINGHNFMVEVATTAFQREKGLSNRDSLSANTGMLFIFPKADIYPFWMKETKIPLDIIYIDNDPSTGSGQGKIVEITTLNPPIDNNIPQYTPKNKADKVLEINANESALGGFKIGDLVEIIY